MPKELLAWQKKELVPLGRFSQPEEQAYLTLLLLDPVMGGYCTGQEYFIEYVLSFCVRSCGDPRPRAIADNQRRCPGLVNVSQLEHNNVALQEHHAFWV